MSANIAARVTLIARDGTVLADSAEDPARMANQAVHPEVARALNAGVGISTRRSDTAGEELIYVAVPVIAGESVQGVARVAAPAAQVQDSVNRSITVIALIGIAGAVFAVLLGYGVASRTSRSIGALTEGARQLTAGELDYRVQALGRDETQELAQAFKPHGGVPAQSRTRSLGGTRQIDGGAQHDGGWRRCNRRQRQDRPGESRGGREPQPHRRGRLRPPLH